MQSAAYILQVFFVCLFVVVQVADLLEETSWRKVRRELSGRKKGFLISFGLLPAPNVQLLLPASLAGRAVRYRIRSPLH